MATQKVTLNFAKEKAVVPFKHQTKQIIFSNFFLIEVMHFDRTKFKVFVRWFAMRIHRYLVGAPSLTQKCKIAINSTF
jgi:hypothetical protein